jgi:ABC-2 type transport system permease protein
MSAVFKREFKAYFNSPIGFILIGIFFFISSLLFATLNLDGNTVDLSGIFNYLIIIYALIIPFITMRLLSEDKKLKTDQCLLTSPVSLPSIVLGKFFSAFVFYAISLSYTIVFAVILNFFQPIEAWVFLGNIVGMLLLGASFIAVGLFVSSLTESQVIAAIGALIINILLIAIQMLTTIFNNTTITNVINYLAIMPRYSDFSIGMFNLADAVYFFSIATVFIFLAVRVLEKRRWS